MQPRIAILSLLSALSIGCDAFIGDGDDVPYADCGRRPDHPRCTGRPSVAISTPASGATVSGTVDISGTASDDQTVARVEIQIDGGTAALAAGTTSWTFALDTTGLADGGHTVTARAIDDAGQQSTASISLVVTNGGQPSAGGYGPQPNITCPAGAVTISPGTNNIQPIVSAHPGGTTFCLRAGVFHLTAPVTPKTGDVFVGELGTILDGTGWTTRDGTQAAFRAHNEDIDGVTIRNLVIRNMPDKCVHAFRDFARNWTLENNELTGCDTGVLLSEGATLRRNSIHHNRIGGYAFYMTNLFPGTVVTLEDNEISFNGGEQKCIDCGRIDWINNWLHHNQGAGIWTDGDGRGSILEGNLLEDNGGAGIMLELAVGATVRNNTLRRNGENALFLSTSRDMDVHSNVFEDNRHAMVQFIDCNAPKLGFFWAPDLGNNLVHHNTVRITAAAPAGAVAALFTYSGATCSAAEVVPYESNTKNIRFEDNTYHVFDSRAWWYWIGPKSFAEWQTVFGHDDTGTVTIGG